MAKRDRRKKSLPPLDLGAPRPPMPPSYVGYPGDPLAQMAAPSVQPHTEGAEISMPVDTAMAVEDDLGPDVAQALTVTEMAAYLDDRGLPYRWTMPRG